MPRGENKRTRIMHKTLAFVMSVIVAGGVLATATAAGAQRYLGPERVYPLPPPGAPGYRETPMFAPDAPPPRNYNNPGLPDFQNGSRG
jgi:hypothetical protein